MNSPGLDLTWTGASVRRRGWPGQSAPAARRALVQALVGAFGALCAFLILEPARLTGGGSGLFEGLNDLFMPGCVLGGTVIPVLLASEQLQQGHRLRALHRAVGGLLLGMLLGSGYSVLAHAFFESFGGGLEGPGAELSARTIGWAVYGLGLGLTAGIAAENGRRAYPCLAAGIAAGAAAGIVQSMLGWAGVFGTLRFMLSLLILGGGVGLATVLADRAVRLAAIRFLSGSREGSEISLHRPVVTLGRDETADVPLFGDPSVAVRHARLVLAAEPYVEAVDPSATVSVDGHEGRGFLLRPGSVIRIGRHRFRLALNTIRLAAGGGIPPPSADLFSSLFEPLGEPVMAMAPLPGAGAAPVQGRTAARVDPPPAGKSIRLRVVAGPSAGQEVVSSGLAITMGREPGNTLLLPEGRVSRRHARIEVVEGCWLLSDLQSTNGTRLNGLRVVRAGLEDGDEIAVGESLIHVELGGSVR